MNNLIVCYYACTIMTVAQAATSQHELDIKKLRDTIAHPQAPSEAVPRKTLHAAFATMTNFPDAVIEIALSFLPKQDMWCKIDSTPPLKDVHAMSMARDGKLFAALEYNKKRLTMFDVATGNILCQKETKKNCYDLELSPNGKHLITSHSVSKSAVTTKKGKLTTDGFWRNITIRHAQTGKEIRSLHIVRYALSPDSKRIAYQDRDSRDDLYDIHVRIEDLVTGKYIDRLSHKKIKATYGLSYSPDGDYIALSSYPQYSKKRREYSIIITIWDSYNGRLYREIETKIDASRPIEGLKFSSNNRLLLWTYGLYEDYDTTVRNNYCNRRGTTVWDLEKNKHLFTQSNNIRSSFLSDSAFIISADLQNINIWEAATGAIIHQFKIPAYEAFISPYNNVIFAIDTNNQLQKWELLPGYEAASLSRTEKAKFRLKKSVSSMRTMFSRLSKK